MKNRESSPLTTYEDHGKSPVSVLEHESSDIDIDVNVLNDSSTNVEDYKFPNHPENDLKEEYKAGNDLKEEYKAGVTAGEAEVEAEDDSYEYSKDAESLSVIVDHAHIMMETTESDFSDEAGHGEIRTLLNIKESMDYSIDNFEVDGESGWNHYENPAGTPALYKLLGAAPLAFKSQEVMSKSGEDLRDSPNERTSHRHALADFLGRMHDVIDTNPDISVKDLALSLEDTVHKFADVDESNLRKFIVNKIRGVRSERVFQKAYENRGEATLRKPSAWQDIKGIDYILETARKTYNIDVKTSLPGVKRDQRIKSPSDMYVIRTGLHNKSRDNRRIIIRPEVTDEMFEEDSFNLKDKYVDEVNESIRNTIHYAKNDYDKESR